MSSYNRITAYGVLIHGRFINDMLQALTSPLTMEQKKRFYIGHKVIEPVSYNDMEDRYKAKYDDIDIDVPDFLVTDFGSRWMEYIDLYMNIHYPLLSIDPTADSRSIAVYVGSTRQVNKDIPNLMWPDSPTLLPSSNRSMGLPARHIPGALPPRKKPEPSETTLSTDEISSEINAEQKGQLSGFLRDAGISREPEAIVWGERMTRGGWQGCIREPWRYRKNQG